VNREGQLPLGSPTPTEWGAEGGPHHTGVHCPWVLIFQRGGRYSPDLILQLWCHRRRHQSPKGGPRDEPTAGERGCEFLQHRVLHDVATVRGTRAQCQRQRVGLDDARLAGQLAEPRQSFNSDRGKGRSMRGSCQPTATPPSLVPPLSSSPATTGGGNGGGRRGPTMVQ
jgi:hypothetical protein